MDLGHLLVDKLDDLEERLERLAVTGDEYHRLEAGRLLYHVISDDLLADVCREVRWPPVRFRVWKATTKADKGVLLDMNRVQLYVPEGYSPTLVEEVGLGQFKNRRILTLLDEPFRVDDVLQLLANSLGGKHHRGPKKEKLERLHEVSTQPWTIQLPPDPPLQLPGLLGEYVLDIGRCTLQATLPLRLVIRMRA